MWTVLFVTINVLIDKCVNIVFIFFHSKNNSDYCYDSWPQHIVPNNGVVFSLPKANRDKA